MIKYLIEKHCYHCSCHIVNNYLGGGEDESHHGAAPEVGGLDDELHPAEIVSRIDEGEFSPQNCEHGEIPLLVGEV